MRPFNYYTPFNLDHAFGIGPKQVQEMSSRAEKLYHTIGSLLATVPAAGKEKIKALFPMNPQEFVSLLFEQELGMCMIQLSDGHVQNYSELVNMYRIMPVLQLL